MQENMAGTCYKAATQHETLFNKKCPRDIEAKINELIGETSNSLGFTAPDQTDIKNFIDFIINCVQRSIVISKISLELDGALNVFYEKSAKATGIIFKENLIHYSIVFNGIYQFSEKKLYDPATLNDLYANMN